MRQTRTVLFLYLFLLSVVSTSLNAAEAAADYSAGIVDRAEVLKTAAEATLEKYPDADEVLLCQELRVRYEPDGRYVQWQEEYTKILTEKSRRDYQMLSSYFTLPYQREEDCTIPLVEVIRPDGTAVKVDVEKQSRVMVDRSQMSANIYDPNSRIRQVALPEVNVGDIVHYIMFDRIVKTRMENSYCEMQTFEGTRPILRAALQIEAPNANPLRRIAVKNEVKGTLKYTATQQPETTIHRWEAHNVPQMFPEPDMPPAWTEVQRVLASTSPDWKSVSAWYWKLCQPRLEAVSPEMKAKAEALVAGKATDTDKIRAVFQFVSQEIRYLGITAEDTAPGYEPHDVKDTFAQKHGVCRDKAALLVALLRLAGFEAFPVLIHTDAKKDEEVPMPYFNHAISAVRLADGKYVLMDSTDENTKQLLPGYLDDKSYLVATPEGDGLRTSPAEPASANLMKIRTKGTLAKDGTLSAESELEFAGINDNVYRGYFSQIKPEERRRFFEGMLKSSIPGARLAEFKLTPEDMMDTETPLSLKMQYRAENLPIIGQDMAMLPVPVLGMRIGLGGRGLGWVNYLLDKAHLKERRFPFQIETACGVQESVSLKLDPSLKKAVLMPSAATIENDKFVWKKSLGLVGDVLQCDIDFRLQKVEYSSPEYLELRKLLQTVEIDQKKMPVLAVQAEAEGQETEEANADAVVLSERAVYDLKSASEWTETRQIRRRILTYAGKKRFAEVKVNFNPVWESVKLTDVKIVSPDGKTATISEKEINLMDAAWVGSAPRYPAEKTLVASLPSVEVGSVIQYTLTRECKGRPFFACQETFQYTEPMLGKELAIRVPAGLALQQTRTGPDILEASSSEKDGVTERKWVARRQERIEAEDFLPPWWTLAPTVSVSCGSYETYGADVASALQKAATGQPETAARAKALLSESNVKLSLEGQIRLLRDFVVRNIRLAGPDLPDAPLSIITPADQTLAQGYGNSADRAAVLAAMLAEAGLSPMFALPTTSARVKSLQEMVALCPTTSWFSGVLVGIEAGGKTLWLNDTSQYDHLGVAPQEGRLALLLRAKPELVTLQVDPALQNAVNRYVTIALKDDGSAEVWGKMEIYGPSFGRMHRQYAEMTPEERRRELQRLVTGISQSATPVGDLKDDFTGYPGIITYAAKVERLAVRDGDFLYAELPEQLSGAVYLRADTRKNPLYWSAPQTERLVAAVLLPPSFKTPAILPRNRRWQLPSGCGFVQASAFLLPNEQSRTVPLGALPGDILLKKPDAPVLIYDNQIRREAGLIPTGQYEDLLEISRQLSHPRTRMILLNKHKTPTAPSAGKKPESKPAAPVAPAEAKPVPATPAK